MICRLEGNKVVGVKQTVKAIKNNAAKTVYIAKDADDKLIQSVKVLVDENSQSVLYIDTMKELGKLCGIDVGAATAAVLND
ncbi:ribosomal L7Ae/L30e/S12e/Gadd45 family protein [Clostridium sp. CX1]|uniref:Ribosomal L7Ae/L30e/S12e/Gadd45 family protein n=1 Tax=Clostridium tanneri TaxID=3037988 RepID=A0ABU4JPZ3_9CLOT|nr:MULTISPECIES: ribosomal L7Ae/L30e/S12e/Gadd45 family protein [unclassified Clostridium]MCT8976516.1 ribosomal L7Ae/L30e/S12e/Gadd45 family protein [Clostridium sp. CX1]MDW8800182.1 ribosomal L7Ae/L30e/S12e/Gadd45 family protein [Clostridium sp. A1-XYC3]